MSRAIVIFALAFIALLEGCTAASTATSASPPNDAATVFARNCARCHGGDRQGQIGPDITAAGLQSRQRTDQFIRDTITNGLRGMPTWKGTLSPEQIEALIKFLRS